MGRSPGACCAVCSLASTVSLCARGDDLADVRRTICHASLDNWQEI